MSSTSPPRGAQRPAVPWWLRWAAMVAGAGTFAWSTAAVLRGGRPDPGPDAPAYPPQTRRQAVGTVAREDPRTPSGDPGGESGRSAASEGYSFAGEESDRFVDGFRWQRSDDGWERDGHGWYHEDDDGLQGDSEEEHGERGRELERREHAWQQQYAGQRRGRDVYWNDGYGPSQAGAGPRPQGPSGADVPPPRPPDARSRPS